MKQPECPFPRLSTAHFSKYDCVALWMHLFGTIGRPALATGFVPGRYNRADLLSLTPAFRNVLNYPILSLGSEPSALSDFAQMFKEKEFFFFKWMSKAWQNTVQRNAKVSTVLKSWLWAHFLLTPASLSPPPKKGGGDMETITLAQGPKTARNMVRFWTPRWLLPAPSCWTLRSC